MNAHGIVLGIKTDEDAWHVTVHARTDEFAGQGEAWFVSKAVQTFASAIAQYPLIGCPELVGRYGPSADGSRGQQTTVALRVYPVGRRGQVGVHVHLESTAWHNTRADEVGRVDLEVLTTYQRLADFAANILSLRPFCSGEVGLLEERLD